MNASSDFVSLKDLRPGQKAKVAGFELDGAVKGRVLEMGVTKGTTVEMVKFAPLGDPMEFKVRGSHISLRKADAAGIRVELI